MQSARPGSLDQQRLQFNRVSFSEAERSVGPDVQQVAVRINNPPLGGTLELAAALPAERVLPAASGPGGTGGAA